MTEPTSTNPKFDFVPRPSVSKFNEPVQTFLVQRRQSQPDLKYGYLACGALVVDESTVPRILLIQRAAGDSMPNLWEVPGGGCDDEDPSVLHSVARELWEEAGINAATIGPRVGDDHIFATKSGKVICKFNFLVNAKKSGEGVVQVKLDPEEHQNYVWASEDDVKAHHAGDIELRFTTEAQEAVVMKAFETVRSLRAAGA